MEKTLRINPDDSQGDVTSIISITLNNHGVVCLPSDTCYSLSCLATSQKATERLIAIKRREGSKPFILAVPSIACAKTYAREWTLETNAIAQAFWPGKITVVVPFQQATSHPIAYSGDKIALRVPALSMMREIMLMVRQPLWSTSANEPGNPPPSRLEQVPAHIIESVDLVIDAGQLAEPIPSTIIDLSVTPPCIVRQGPVKPEAITRNTNLKVRIKTVNS